MDASQILAWPPKSIAHLKHLEMKGKEWMESNMWNVESGEITISICFPSIFCFLGLLGLEQNLIAEEGAKKLAAVFHSVVSVVSNLFPTNRFFPGRQFYPVAERTNFEALHIKLRLNGNPLGEARICHLWIIHFYYVLLCFTQLNITCLLTWHDVWSSHWRFWFSLARLAYVPQWWGVSSHSSNSGIDSAVSHA